MDVEYIWEFISLAEELNYHAVAEKRGISAGALSKHIKELEQELGSPLFVRTTRSVALSSFGQTFLKEAQQFFRSYQNFMRSVKKLQVNPRTALSIAATRSAMNYNVPEMLTSYLAANPQRSIALHETTISKVRSLLRYGSYRFAFISSGAKDDPEFSSIPIAEDNLAIMLPVDHPLAKGKTVDISDLRELCIHCFPDDGVQPFFLDACMKAGFLPNLELCGAGGKLLAGVVENHHGAAIMTRQTAMRFATPNIAVLDIVPMQKMYINCIYAADSVQEADATDFLNAVQAFDPISG